MAATQYSQGGRVPLPPTTWIVESWLHNVNFGMKVENPSLEEEEAP
jgi:hypothetical protein